MAVVDLGFVSGLFAVFGDPMLYAGRLGRLRALLVLALLGTVLTGGVLICMVLAWWRGVWSLPARFHYTGRCPGRSRVEMVPSNLEPARFPPVITAGNAPTM